MIFQIKKINKDIKKINIIIIFGNKNTYNLLEVKLNDEFFINNTFKIIPEKIY